VDDLAVGCGRVDPGDLLGERLARARHGRAVEHPGVDELLDRQRWRTRIELADAIVEYLDIWHNRRRRRIALGRLSPLEFENRSKIIVAEQLGVSRPTVSKWIGRYRAEG
jgi:hypothetical protein